MSTAALPSLPDSDIAIAATRFVESRVPEFVLNHCVRGYYYGRVLADQYGLRSGTDYDDELVFLAHVLHDLGVSTTAQSPERFEVHGADQAVAFARSAGLADEKLPVLWDAVALHTSVGIASRKHPEIAITHLGISADITGHDRDRLPADLVAAVHERYPRHDLGYALTELIVEGARRDPAKANPLTFPGHLLSLYAPSGTTPTWFDVVAGNGWGDQPVSDEVREGAESPEQLGRVWADRLARGDLDGLVALYDEDAIYIPGPGRIARGRREIRAALAEMVDARTTVDIEPRSCRVTSDQALIVNRVTVHFGDSGETQTVVTTEAARRRPNGRWFALVDDPFALAAVDQGEPAATAT